MKKIVVVSMLLAGCFSAPTPMRSIKYPLQPNAKCLVVFLPGAGDVAEEFDKRGWVETMRKSGLSVDVIAANATLGYYLKGTVRDRLPTDVIKPAMAEGHYQQLWVMGMSMGGFGSLFYAQLHPGEVTGVLAMAPYLGDDSLSKEIKKQGGLAAWKAPAKAESTKDNYQQQLWRWLQATTTGAEPGPQIFMGWGTEDSLGPANELVAAALPKERVFTEKGGHDWPPWKIVVDRFIAEGTFAKSCQADATAAVP